MITLLQIGLRRSVQASIEPASPQPRIAMLVLSLCWMTGLGVAVPGLPPGVIVPGSLALEVGRGNEIGVVLCDGASSGECR